MKAITLQIRYYIKYNIYIHCTELHVHVHVHKCMCTCTQCTCTCMYIYYPQRHIHVYLCARTQMYNPQRYTYLCTCTHNCRQTDVQWIYNVIVVKFLVFLHINYIVQGEDEALFIEYRSRLKVLFDNIAQLVCILLYTVYVNKMSLYSNSNYLSSTVSIVQ